MYNEDYLVHYGVKGMKWGVRRYQNTDGSLISAKANYKSAKKAYNKSYNKAYNYSARHPISQFVSKKKSAKSNQLWDEAITNAEKLRTAKQEYKQAKISSKTVKRADKAQQKLAKTKMKDLQKQYGALEDKLTYGKKADTRMNSQVLKEMERIENMMKTPTVKEQIKKRRGNI